MDIAVIGKYVITLGNQCLPIIGKRDLRRYLISGKCLVGSRSRFGILDVAGRDVEGFGTASVVFAKTCDRDRTLPNIGVSPL